MIDEITSLKKKQLISVDNTISKKLTNMEDFTVKKTISYELDESLVTIVELNDDYFLIATDLSGDNQFAICEEFDSDYINIDIGEYEFTEELKIKNDRKKTLYQLIGSNSFEEEDAFAEYNNDDKYYNYVLVHKSEDSVMIYRGVLIEEDDLIL